MRTTLLIAIITMTFVGVSAQDLRVRRVGEPDERAPKLTLSTSESYNDELYRWGNENVFLRTGSNLIIPLSDSPSLQLGLESPLSTRGMTGATINRALIMRVDIFTKYGDKLAVKDCVVETRITGYKSGFKNRAILMIEPRVIQFRAQTAILIGKTAAGMPIMLKPGVWSLQLHCTIQAIEAENMHWYASDDTESLVVKGKRFEASSDPNNFSDPYSDLQYINPFGAVAYSISRVGKLVGILLHRPNINLPATTQVFFRIDRIEATYLASLPPAENMTNR